ncbi:hypothetical protein BGP_4042 [Beggiatoa sp. PS]|nr:hypothetical protein BGP_4042 [Beggiatoa sp. PS]
MLSSIFQGRKLSALTPGFLSDNPWTKRRKGEAFHQDNARHQPPLRNVAKQRSAGCLSEIFERNAKKNRMFGQLC